MAERDGTMVGQKFGDYRLQEVIGTGGMGTVYRAEHEHLQKSYAVKILPRELACDRGFVDRFRDEARFMARMDHPHIVTVHQMGCQDGQYYMAMDYVTGPDGKPLSLHDYLRECPEGRLHPEEVHRWALQIAEAFAYAHGRGVVHRDLKPANILIDADRNVRLTDFGLAKAVGEEFIRSQIHQSMQATLGSAPTLGRGGSPIPSQSLGDLATMSPRLTGGRCWTGFRTNRVLPWTRHPENPGWRPCLGGVFWYHGGGRCSPGEEGCMVAADGSGG